MGSKSSGKRKQRENKASPIIIVIEDFSTNVKFRGIRYVCLERRKENEENINNDSG